MTEKHVLHLGKMSSISASDSESRFDLFVFLNPVTPAVSCGQSIKIEKSGLIELKFFKLKITHSASSSNAI